MTSKLELDDIQSGALRPRPAPFAATYVALRMDDRQAGRELMLRLSEVVSAASDPGGPEKETWVSAALTVHGLRALGVAEASLETFPLPFRQGMAARAGILGDTGESAPQHWEKPLGSNEVHVVLTAVSTDAAKLEASVARAREAYREKTAIVPVWRQDCGVQVGEKEPFGYRDGVSHPAIEGSGIPGTNPHEAPLKAGEFVLGYPDEIDDAPIIPQPAELSRNGSFIVFRKLHQRVAAFRRYLRENATESMPEELLAAKLMGRWRSGAPLALSPTKDDAELGSDSSRNNAFQFQADDPIGYRTPKGSHIRRMNPRDADISGVARIHRMIRRGSGYGPPLPQGVMDDDGADRGLMFAFVGAHLVRQFEFVQSEWMNDGAFFGGSSEKDPVSGAADGKGTFDVPRRPLRLRLQGLSRFVVTRGGEYGFMPGLNALRWLGTLEG